MKCASPVSLPNARHCDTSHRLASATVILHIRNLIIKKIALGIKAYYANLKFFKSRLVTKGSKLKLYRTVIRPTVTCASETWVLKENIIQKLLVFERKILRGIFGPTKEN